MHGTAERIPTAGVHLDADVTIPSRARGLVLFAHGSGSSRRSPRNRAVAEVLHQHGHATVLTDLLTSDEERIDALTRQLRFDIGLLADRLIGLIDWLVREAPTAALSIGLFGASTGGAAALAAAAARPRAVRAIVSRGGRPDLAGSALSQVRAPTLLLIGGRDHQVIDLNQRQAARALTGICRIQLIDGATHLFSEPGALDQVAQHAVAWFDEHLAGGSP